ncbi:MAG: hypothetical protein JNL69_13195 [Bacteroidia bacterium]|nr:hypothetical protein [Bacteroidia bacterium]
MKRKININRPEVDSEEIAKRKDFDSVLKATKATGKPLIKKTWFLSSLVVATIAIVTTTVLLNKNNVYQTSINDVNDSLVLEKFYKTEEAKPCIAPPIEGLNIPYTTYKVMAENGGTFEFKTGSTFTVPKNAFVNQNGTILKGEVEIRYREFHDMVDVFVAGIPMTYDSAGTRYHFESAGMLEMLAYQNGEQVYMAKDKSIEVQLASNNSDPKFNLYKLDTLKNNWSCLGKDKIVSTSTKNEFTEDMSHEQIVIANNLKELEIKKSTISTEKQNKVSTLPQLPIEPKKPQKSKDDFYTFNLAVDPKEFPELVVYKDVLFEVGAENKNFSKSMYDITWDNAYIKNGTVKNENYMLTLQKGNKKYDLIVYPVFEGKSYDNAIKTFQEKFEKYNSALVKRETQEKQIEAEYQTKLAEIKRKQDELERKWKAEQNNQFNAMDTEQKVKRLFTMNSFGVYNCDNPMSYPKGANYNAQLSNNNGAKLLIYDVYLVDKSLNAMFTFTKNPIYNFSYNPQTNNILWTVEHGKLYYLLPEDFKSLKNGSGFATIQLKRVEQKFKTPEEMKEFFGI